MARAESERRQGILDAAVRVFAEAGWRGATIRAIGREAGVNSALIYYYFEDKQTVFVEAVGRVIHGFVERLQGRTRDLRGARDRLGFLVDGIFDYFAEHPVRMRLMAVALSLHPELFGRALTAALKRERLVPIEVLAEGMARGEMRRTHPVGAWWSVMGMCLFSAQMGDVVGRLDPRALPGPSFDMEERREQIIDLLVHGLAVSKNQPRRG